MLSKTTLLEKAVEITKEYVRGSGGMAPETVLERVYKKLVGLREDTARD